MAHSMNILGKLIAILDAKASAPVDHRARGLTPKLDDLEQRMVLSGLGHHNHHLVAHLVSTAAVSSASTTTAATTGSTSSTTTATTGSTSGTTTATPTTTATATDNSGFDFGGGGRGGRGGGMRGFQRGSNPTTLSSSTTTSGSTSTTGNTGPDFGGMTKDTQLTTDLQKLRTDENAVIAASSVTDAQRFALSNDLRTIAQSGVTVDNTALKTVGDNLLTALADGSYDANADTAASIKTAFTAAFWGTTIDQTAIDKAYTDFVVVARGLNISTTQLTMLAADQTAIQADFTRLGITSTDTHGPGQSSNLDLILGGGGPGFGGGGPGFGGGFGGGGPGFGGGGFGGGGPGFGGGHNGHRA